MNKRNYTLYAIDFDGTLVENNWPDIGKTNRDVLEAVQNLEKAGDKWILWTMRSGEPLEAAKEWCRRHNIHPIAVNDNDPKLIEDFGNNPRKVYADWYIDDHNLNMLNFADVYNTTYSYATLTFYGKELRARIKECDRALKEFKYQFKRSQRWEMPNDIQRNINDLIKYYKKLRYRIIKAALYLWSIGKGDTAHLGCFAAQVPRRRICPLLEHGLEYKARAEKMSEEQIMAILESGIRNGSFM
jgi:hydroxymethylpyrimidine pyrophosphatase-like HAD family hydrolase